MISEKANLARYTITTNGDSRVSAKKTITYANTYGTLPTPTRTGYTFNGWYNGITLGNVSISAATGNYNYREI